MISDYYGVILFYSGVLLLLYLNKDKFEKQATLIYLYKTKLGLKLMNSMAKKFGKLLRFLGYIGIVVAYLGFILVTYALVLNAYDLIIDKPGAIGGSPVIPGLPIAGLGIKFPLVIGWISLFIIMIVHEFSHGVIARAHKIKVKSSGIAFFGPLLAAFVEPDEKNLSKVSHSKQHSVFAAGPVSNIILWLLCGFLILAVVPGILSMTYTDGVVIGAMQEDLPAYNSGFPEKTTLIAVNDVPITKLAELEAALDEVNPGDEITLTSEEGSFSMITSENPERPGEAYIGIWIYEEARKLNNDTFLNNILYKGLLWVLELLKWTAFISINIGLINLFPIFITDGARMLRLNFEYFIKDKKKAFEYWKHVNTAAVLVILILLFLPMFRNIFEFIISFLF